VRLLCEFRDQRDDSAAAGPQSDGAHVAEDGSIGPATIIALNAFNQADVYRQYKQGRVDFYQQLGKRFPKFLTGWLNRVNTFPNL
jgi:type VI secretion system secreted protein VgrG